jgi:branched-chain amino acid transport system permease protein
LRTRGEWALFIALVTMPFLAPWFAPKYLGTFVVIGISIVSVLGLYVTMGMAGQINLGQAAFMGVGAYATALATKAGLPSVLALVLSGASAGCFGLIFGLPALRIKGFYLAISTLAAQVVFESVVVRLPRSIFGGTLGLGLAPASMLGIRLTSERGIYFLVVATVLVLLYGTYNLGRSRVGRALLSIREDDVVAPILGVNLFWYKSLAFVIGAFYGGIAGGLWAFYTRYVVADQFTFFQSVWLVGMLIVGGVGSVKGAIVGPIVVRGIEQVVTIFGPQMSRWVPFVGSEFWYALMHILLGFAILLVVITEPRGLAHRIDILRTSYGVWPFPYVRRD